ncbi:hypothetical protein [Breoghania sp. JC706]|uniref:hypothetical protein n=1 Tax=Breoghania sp. JC706 TaxID=3117732 RepID=UPI00300A3B04
MLAKIGTLIVSLAVIFMIVAVLSDRNGRMKRMRDQKARKSGRKSAKTLVRDPESGKYRTRDDDDEV